MNWPSKTIDCIGLTPCNHEEADSRMFLHVKHAKGCGHQNILVKSVDSDIIVIAILVYHQLNIDKFWVEYGVGKHRRFVPIHEYAVAIGEDKCSALSFWYAFTGCDTVSAFAGRGKKTAWDIWSALPSVTTAFSELSNCPTTITEEHITLIQRYVVLLYDKTSSLADVNDCRQVLFTKKSRSIENIPPTKAALFQHIKRTCYQAGYVWSQCLDEIMELPNPCNWGWIKSSTGYEPVWSEQPEASKHFYELIKSGCKKDVLSCVNV